MLVFFFFSSRRRHTRLQGDWSSDVCSSDLTLVNGLVERGTALAQGAAEGRPGIVQRLDRDTSGLLLVAKTDLAHRRLTRMIERREVERVYAALAWGHFAKSPVDIEAPITRHPSD